MTDITNDVEVVEEVEVNELELLKHELAEAKKAIDALSNKKNELIKETKQAKEEKRRASEMAEQAKQEQTMTAQKNGEFEKLWAREKEEKEKALSELAKDRQDRRNEKIDLAAMKLAVDLAKGDANKAELLSVFLAKSISNVADDYGRVDDDVLFDVKKQFESNNKFTPLLGGNLSVGGSAPGNTRSAQASTKEITRAEFEAMDQRARAQFFQKGGKLVG